MQKRSSITKKITSQNFAMCLQKFREVDFQRFTLMGEMLYRIDKGIPVSGSTFFVKCFFVQSAANGGYSTGGFADENGKVAGRKAQFQQHAHFPFGFGKRMKIGNRLFESGQIKPKPLCKVLPHVCFQIEVMILAAAHGCKDRGRLQSGQSSCDGLLVLC